ncbi:MAG: glycoside hydrolase family 127 protein [Victivallales bacterium]|nr:glycoside hydrolase family 127 protein [Victivallales bacterium]
MKIHNRCSDIFLSPDIGATILHGEIGEMAERMFFHRINSPKARNTVYRETIDAFRNKLDDAQKVIGIWQGEYWGKWIISAARVARYQHNEELISFVRSAAWELLSLRDSDGCISTYRARNVFSAAPKEEVIKVLGVPSEWWWNIWCRKYTLWGLIEAGKLTEDEHIMEAAEKLLDQLIDTLEKKNIDIHRTGTFLGLASCSILKPVVLLYRETGKEKFRIFADTIVHGWEREDGRAPNLIRNALSGKPIDEWYPEIVGWTKAYEMMSCLDGLLEYYRLTGYENALKTVESMYELLLKHESNRPGGVGYNDQFRCAGVYLNSLTEPCDVIHWIRLCFELFKLTGKPRYMDTLEHAFLNAFLAGIFKDGSWGMRTVRSSGHHTVAPEQAKMRFNHCCVNNMPRGLINGAESCAMLSAEGVVVNLYLPFAMKTVSPFAGAIRITVSGSYLSNGKVHIHAENEKATTLSLRIPGWSRTAVIRHEGKCREAVAGYATLRLESGVHEIDLEFRLNPTVSVFPYPGEPEKLSDWHRIRYFEGKGTEHLELMKGYYATVSSGPLLLARSKLFGNSEEEMFAPSRLARGEWTVTLTPEPRTGCLAAFNAEFRSKDGTMFSSRVGDFASAGNIDSGDPKLFNMFF